MSDARQILIVGLGHVGQPLAVKLVEAGLTVYGVDTDPRVIKSICNGSSHVHEPGVAETMKKYLNTLLFVGLPDPVTFPMTGTIIISVETSHPRGKRSPVLTSLKRAAGWVGSLLKPGHLVLIRSTVPIGVTKTVLLPLLERGGLKAGCDFGLAYCPERTVEGASLRELGSIPQIIGAIDAQSARGAEAVFSKVTRRVVHVPSLEAAEAVKLIDNAYRDTRFAFANTMAEMCEQLGLNAWEVIRAANCDYPRNSIPVPSPGVGGSCLPKDSRLLSHSARRAGLHLPLLKAARRVNEDGPRRLAARLRQIVSLQDATIFIAGFAFKGVPETGDIRESPTLALVDELKHDGARIIGYDPAVCTDTIAAAGALPVKSLAAGLQSCEICVFMTNHIEFTKLSTEGLARHLPAGAVVVDGWGLFSPQECATRGLRYLGVGIG